ncbi:MAG: DNA polymerase IV, partial [Lepagella sp.]
IKLKIKRQTQLTASAGVSFNKFLAKIASDWRKPNGLCVIHPAQAQEFVDKVPIEDFWGVGPATARRMHELGITDGASLRKVPLHVLMRHFGKSGRIFYDFARCIDSRPVKPDRIRKSVGCETTLTEDVSDPEAIMRIVEELAADLERRIARSGFRGPTFTLKVKYADFRTHSRSHTYPQALTRREEFVEAARRLLPSAVPAGQLIRLVGIGTGVNTPPSRDHGRWVQLEIDFGEY